MVGSDVKTYWLLAILGICVLSLCHDQKLAPMVAAENCDTDMRGLEIECMAFMNKGIPNKPEDPNDRCCKIIKQVNVPCCCNNLNRKIGFPPGYHTIGDLLNWNKVLHCFNYCGRPFHAGYKCGPFTVPPGPPPK
ncbi:hypothetical protein VNO77_26882 [Canavalia gladiata]|uniref:Bifunctional inhibitor/plant lipid transfer protein/seed storage helical domain-containing protein n=1 Tax=Canavalia gladiata TaxID=3824 RepID=A0AAN9KT54_CANGL